MTPDIPCCARCLYRLLWPVLLLLTLALLAELLQLDLMVADWIHRASGNTWSLRDAWLTRGLLHEGGRMLVALLLVALLVTLAASYWYTPLRGWRRGLVYLLVSALLAGLAVNVLKRLTHVDCPWDLLRYGGDYPYVGLFEAHPDTFRYGACFPAGHASAGYSWLGLYFLVRDRLPRWRWLALGVVVMMGAAFGVAQQLRGAHFLSHDLWTLALCWGVAVMAYVAFRCRLGPAPAQN
jgi:membrane-associated PAP2 superfamily phosphatase